MVSYLIKKISDRKEQKSLNPFCNGQWSRTTNLYITPKIIISLNPFCNGQWSRTISLSLLGLEKMCLNPFCNGQWSRTTKQSTNIRLAFVLILFVMDNGLVLVVESLLFTRLKSLNPFCNGQWSRTRPYKTILIISKLKSSTKQILTFLNRKLTIP